MQATLENTYIKKEYCRKNKSIVLHSIFYIQIFSYIVLSNAFTINFGDRFPVKISEFFSVITILMSFFLFVVSNKKIKTNTSGQRWLYLWIAYVIILDFFCILINKFSLSDSLYGLLYLFRIIHLIVLVRSLVFLIRNQGICLSSVVKFIKFCYMIVVVIGFIQYVLFPVAYDWYDVFYKMGFYWPTPDPHHDRMLSTYLDPNYLASCLVIPISICLAQLLSIKQKNKKTKVLRLKLISEILIFLFAILLTKSRSGIVGLATICFVYVVLFCIKRKIKIQNILLLILVFLVFTYLLFFSNITVFERIRNFSSDPSATHRFDSWSHSLEYFKDSNYFGIGYNMLGAYKISIGEEVGNAANYGMDSSILFMLVTTGILGVLIFSYGILKIIVCPQKHYLNYAFKLLIIGSVIMSFFNNLLFNVVWLFPVLFMGIILDDKKILVKAKNGVL